MKMEDIKLNPRQERKNIIILQAKYGIKKPEWLMKNTVYRYGRGVYKLPSLLSVEEHIMNMD